MTIRSRLLSTVALPVLVLAAVVVLSITLMRQIDEGLEELYVDRIEPLAQLKTVVDRYAVSIIDAANKVNAGVMSPRVARNELAAARQDIEQIWQQYMSTTLTAEEGRLARQAQDLFTPANQSIDELDRRLASITGSGAGELQSYIGNLYEAIDPISGVFNELVDLQLREAEIKRNEVHASTLSMSWWFAGLSLMATLVVILLGSRTYIAITNPLTQMQQVIEQIESSKNLSLRVPVIRNDELGAISDDVNRLLEIFSQLISELNLAIDQLVTASDEMSAISAQSSQGMSKQLGETEMVATAMNEMTATVQEVAQHASSAAQSAVAADGQAQEGQQVVEETQRMIRHMAEIFAESTATVEQVNAESDEIGTVIDVIRGIAEQTNLLALNAAIEAARAGDQGRGFAVVADEVRELASRTQKSTTDIQNMIEKLQKGVKEVVGSMNSGQKMVQETVNYSEQAGQALQTIAAAVATVNDMNMQIASAAEEQSSVAEEINQRVLAINDVSREAAEAAGHSSTASEELARLANGLQEQASRFRVS